MYGLLCLLNSINTYPKDYPSDPLKTPAWLVNEMELVLPNLWGIMIPHSKENVFNQLYFMRWDRDGKAGYVEWFISGKHTILEGS
jgi:hypothetical protein